MPALVAFGRKWGIGSDDLVFPGIIDLLLRLTLLFSTFIIYMKNESDIIWPEGQSMRIFIYGIFIIFHFEIILTGALTYFSMSGSIMSERKYVTPTLYLRLILQMAELSWNILGTIWVINGTLDFSEKIPEANCLIKTCLIVNWVMTFIQFLCIYIIFDPLGSTDVLVQKLALDQKNAERWENRIKNLCFCYGSGDKHPSLQSAFQEIGRVIGNLFESDDLVASDITAGIFLLFLKRKRESESLSAVKIEKIPFKTQSEKFNKNPITREVEAVEDKFYASGLADEPWLSLKLLNHIQKFALGCFTWPLVVCCKPSLISPICKKMICPCSLRNEYPEDLEIEGDSCFCNTVSMKHIANIEFEDIAFASFKNKIFKTPFYVSLDHKSKSIVISIRGTLSLVDFLTDLACWPELFNEPSLPPTFMAHHGILQNAKMIRQKLEESGVIRKLTGNHPDYKLIVTGVSLGAGTAAVVAILMKFKYPDIKAFCFSPPAGLLSEECAAWSENFIFSIAYGDDMVLRLSINSTEKLKQSVVRALYESPTPKYKILLGGAQLMAGCGNRACFRKSYLKNSNKSSEISTNESTFELSAISRIGNESEEDANKESLQVYEIEELKEKFKDVVRLYPPGKILHVTETSYFKLQQKNQDYLGGPPYKMRFADRKEFDEMVISPRMFVDHLPFNMRKAIKYFTSSAENYEVFLSTTASTGTNL